MSGYATLHFYDEMARTVIELGLTGEVDPLEVASLLFMADANAPSQQMGYEDSLVQRAACVAAEATSNQHNPEWGVIMMRALKDLL